MKLILFSGGVYVAMFVGGIMLIVMGQDIGWALAVASQGMILLLGVLTGALNQKQTMQDTADFIIRGQVADNQADVAKLKALGTLASTVWRQSAQFHRNQLQHEEVIDGDWDTLLGDFNLLPAGSSEE